MKKSSVRDFVILIILIPIFLWAAFQISSRMEDKLPPYSVINKSSQGLSIFYETLNKLNYPVERKLEPPGTEENDGIQVIAEGGSFDVNSSEIKSYVEKGGVLVYLVPNSLSYIDYGAAPESKEGIDIYKYGSGKIITSDVLDITNKALTEDTGSAYRLLEEIDLNPYKRIYFNETYLFSEVEAKSLWDYIPMEYRLIIYQIFIALVAYFCYKGKRFGKPVPLYEEAERTENEYLYSASALYREAKCLDLMFQNYYNSFLREIRRGEENWLQFWDGENLPGIERARRLYSFAVSRNGKGRPKEYIEMITILEEFKKTLEKRREAYWKTLKNSR